MDWKAFAVLAAWLVASAIINAALAFKTPEEWDAYAASHPTGAALRKVLRKVGLDLPGLIRLVKRIIDARANRAQ